VYQSQFQGGIASVGDECGSEDACEQFCHNHCSDLDDDVEGQRRFLVNAMEKQLERVTEHAERVESGMSSDEALSAKKALGGRGGAKNSVTGFNELEADFEAKYASLFAGSDRRRSGNLAGGMSAQEMTAVFKDDLRNQMTMYASSWGFRPQASGVLCEVTDQGGVRCPGLREFTTEYGKARDVVAQLFYILDLYFCQDCAEESGVIMSSTDGASLNLDRNGDNKFTPAFSPDDRFRLDFGFSDADFTKSRYAKNVFPDKKGFLTSDECDVIESTMDLNYGETILNEFESLTSDQTEAFYNGIMAEVQATSVVEFKYITCTKFVAKDAKKAHKFDQARMQCQMEMENLPEHYNVDSVRAAFAIALWHQITAQLMPEYAAKEFNKYTSTTTTTVSTTTITTSTTTIEFNPEEDFTDEQLDEIATLDISALMIKETEARAAAATALSAYKDALNNDDSTKEELAVLNQALNDANQAVTVLQAMVEMKNEQDRELAASTAAELAGALPIIPILAGAGGLILILIVIIAVGGGGGGGGGDPYASRPGDASVVAFENPMYDDPGQNQRQNPIADDEEEDGGLYDEPAFNAEEDDAAAGGGYLDVEPDEEEESEESAAESAEESASEEESSEEDDE